MIHSGFARRWMSEQRAKRIRRIYYRVMDDIGIFLWGMVGIFITAMGIWVLWHR